MTPVNPRRERTPPPTQTQYFGPTKSQAGTDSCNMYFPSSSQSHRETCDLATSSPVPSELLREEEMLRAENEKLQRLLQTRARERECAPPSPAPPSPAHGTGRYYMESSRMDHNPRNVLHRDDAAGQRRDVKPEVLSWIGEPRENRQRGFADHSHRPHGRERKTDPRMMPAGEPEVFKRVEFPKSHSRRLHDAGGRETPRGSPVMSYMDPWNDPRRLR
eukprot:NODE_3849_length_908_cov_8.924331_g3543_i0.p1 GENE.NODE_3849_length_908_cov_8.924331_g3543_i0~~NODE_3849_length_908_cov_8.924331_g3543_i0.p1  ORF type:complete len:245 (-),score=30.55 NODE_3849_length_908_cov_8.924331_g3543_i0:173-826(-)